MYVCVCVCVYSSSNREAVIANIAVDDFTSMCRAVVDHYAVSVPLLEYTQRAAGSYNITG